jgi:hypothetical protein
MVQSQPWEIVHETLSQKNPSQKRTSGMVQGVGSEFKPQSRRKKKKRTIWGQRLWREQLTKQTHHGSFLNLEIKALFR